MKDFEGDGIHGQPRRPTPCSSNKSPPFVSRAFQPGGMQTTEVGLHQMLSGDLYVVMGDRAGAGGRTVRVYFNPLVSLIWLGAVIMFLGGIISLTDRRYRIGAPKPARRQALAAAE